MFAIAVTPGLAGRPFGAAARLAYLRYNVLLIGARVPITMLAAAAARAAGDGGGSNGHLVASAPPPVPTGAAAEAETAYEVVLFPCDMILQEGMHLHAVAFDTIDLAALLQACLLTLSCST
jgi:hypothetical protein